jgi:AcrR family transcriptional regulator
MRVYGGIDAAERRSQRRARLLEAGLDLLADGGWQAATVTAICKRSKLTPRYFYESFDDRDSLLVAIFDGIIGEVGERVGRSARATSEELVRQTISAWLEIVSADPRKGRAAFVEALGSEAVMQRRLEAMRRFADLLTGGERGAVRVAALVVSGGLVEAMVEWVEGRSPVGRDELIDQYTAVCTAALDAATAG